MPTDQHEESPIKYVLSGWCGSGAHERCAGVYVGFVCPCEHHTAPPPPLELAVATVHCFFGCPAVVGSTDLQEAHAAMEAHYFDTHRADIRAAVGWMTGGAA